MAEDGGLRGGVGEGVREEYQGWEGDGEGEVVVCSLGRRFCGGASRLSSRVGD
jgi:hypothetical protein